MNIEYLVWILNLNVDFEYWILYLNIESKYWIWMLNIEYWILNLSIECWMLNIEDWILNIEIDYWMWKLNVTGSESDLKDPESIFRLQTSGVFVSVDMLKLMGWGWVVLLVSGYCARRMVVNNFFKELWD